MSVITGGIQENRTDECNHRRYHWPCSSDRESNSIQWYNLCFRWQSWTRFHPQSFHTHTDNRPCSRETESNLLLMPDAADVMWRNEDVCDIFQYHILRFQLSFQKKKKTTKSICLVPWLDFEECCSFWSGGNLHNTVKLVLLTKCRILGIIILFLNNQNLAIFPDPQFFLCFSYSCIFLYPFYIYL